MTLRLLYIVSHPIQYQAPLLRQIARQPEIRLRVLFENVASDGQHYDPGFGREIQWDVPLREGYDSAPTDDVSIADEIAACDVLWVHGWQTATLRSAIRRASRQGKPVLMRGENWTGAMPDGQGLRGWLKRRYLSLIFRNCSGFLCIGKMNRDYYRDHGIDDARLFDMPYAIDNDMFREKADAADIGALRYSLGIPEDRKVILYAGKLSPRKHPDILLTAWKTANWAGPKPVLLFVGDGPLMTSMRHEASEDVIFAGFRNQTELPGLYRLADLFVLAASREAWGLAINEAMVCGTAVIASTECGAAHDLIDRNCGRLVPPGDALALATILPEALESSRPLGENARLRMAEWDFDADIRGLTHAIRSVA